MPALCIRARRVFCMEAKSLLYFFMKMNIVRGVLLASLLIVLAVCMAVPFVSNETLAGINVGLYSLARPLFLLSLGVIFCFGIGPNCVEFWRVRRSRRECCKAHRALYPYFNEYSLEI